MLTLLLCDLLFIGCLRVVFTVRVHTILHCVWENCNPVDNVREKWQSECILIKLNALVFECICERTEKFCEKILFDSGVINL